MTSEHLATIDAATWPGVAHVPEGNLAGVRARVAEAKFAKACNTASLTLTGDADLIVEHEALFYRLATSGWTGLAESYLAGEWHASDDDTLVTVLQALIGVAYRPSTPTVTPGPAVGELPPALVRLYSGDRMSPFQGIYSSGVPTTVRESLPSYVPGAGRGNEPGNHFVDVTRIDEPIGVNRQDLADGQRRAVEFLLDAARVGPSTHALEFPSAGGALAIAGTQRHATVDSVTTDPVLRDALVERYVLAGVADSIHLELVDELRLWRGQYDAIVSADALHTYAGSQRDEYVRSLDRLLTIGGKVAMQTVVATEKWTKTATDAVQALRAYIWPGLTIDTMEDIHRLIDRRTNLRITAQLHMGEHYALSLASQRELFLGHNREAAAEGFDVVYRRLWEYQFALREALVRLGMVDGVQLTMGHRNRGGRR